MAFQEMLSTLRFEYYAALAAICHDEQATRLLDQEKSAAFPSFYDYLIERGFNRFQLSAHGIGRDAQ